jgi:hypothetical protein
MWRWLRWVLSGLLAVISVVTIYIVRMDHKARLAEREQALRYGVMIEEVRREYPIGTSLADVISQLRHKNIAYSEGSRELLLPLGSDPSYVWYCNSWVTYADLKFDGDVYHESPAFKLQMVSKKVIGGTCL